MNVSTIKEKSNMNFLNKIINFNSDVCSQDNIELLPQGWVELGRNSNENMLRLKTQNMDKESFVQEINSNFIFTTE